MAWSVVDSDGDGVSDADEIVAGTDPHSATDTPTLRQLTDLATEHRLPSFDNGFAAFVVLPADLVALREERSGIDGLDARLFEGFGLEGRKDTLGRLGISMDQMKDLGVDPARSGFTIGLEPTRKDDSGLPGRRVGGLDIGTISADHGDAGSDHEADPEELTPLAPLEHGGIVDTKPIVNGTAYIYKDGTEIYKQSTGGVQYRPDGGVQSTWTYDKPKKYANPDADSMTVTPEMEAAWLRTAGAATRTVEGWQAPKGDGEVDPNRGRALVSFIDSELGAMTVVAVDAPRITSAQPEVRPDLPSPLVGAPKGGVTGGVKGGGGCADSVCGG